MGAAQDLEQPLCQPVGWEGCWTLGHREGKVSKAPLRKCVPGWVTMTCWRCQGCGLHKAVALYVQRELRICSRGGAEHWGKRCGCCQRYQRGPGLPAGVTVVALRQDLLCSQENCRDSSSGSAQGNARFRRGHDHNPAAWRGAELGTSALQ